MKNHILRIVYKTFKNQSFIESSTQNSNNFFSSETIFNKNLANKLGDIATSFGLKNDVLSLEDFADLQKGTIYKSR